MATPHVAGAMALYLQVNPSATPAAVRTALANQVTLNKITNPGSDSPNRLLYTRWIGGGLTNPQGVIATSLSLANRPYGLAISASNTAYITRLDAAAMQRVNLPAFSFVGVVTVGSVPSASPSTPRAASRGWRTSSVTTSASWTSRRTRSCARSPCRAIRSC